MPVYPKPRGDCVYCNATAVYEKGKEGMSGDLHWSNGAVTERFDGSVSSCCPPCNRSNLAAAEERKAKFENAQARAMHGKRNGK